MSKIAKTTIAIFGIGNFGYAILKHLDNKKMPNVELRAYDIDAKIVDSLHHHRYHPYLHQKTTADKRIIFVNSPEELVKGADIVVMAIASGATRSALSSIKNHLTDNVIILNTSKALDKQTGKRLSEIYSNQLRNIDYRYAVLAGGTIAKDLFHHEPLGVDIASTDKSALSALKKVFESNNLYVNSTNDLIGVELASAFKNIVSIVAGIVKGLGFSYGSETYIISFLADKIAEVCVSEYNVSPATFQIGSQCWGNDMWMSCTGNTRNREFGVLVGKGYSPKESLKSMVQANKTVEGVNTLRIISSTPLIERITLLQQIKLLIIDGSITVEELKQSFFSLR